MPLILFHIHCWTTKGFTISHLHQWTYIYTLNFWYMWFFLLVSMVPLKSTKKLSMPPTLFTLRTMCQMFLGTWLRRKYIHLNYWTMIFKVCYWIKALILNITRYLLSHHSHSIWYQMCHWYQVWFFTMLAKYEAPNLSLLYAKVRNFTSVFIMSCDGHVTPEPKTSRQGEGGQKKYLGIQCRSMASNRFLN